MRRRDWGKQHRIPAGIGHESPTRQLTLEMEVGVGIQQVGGEEEGPSGHVTAYIHGQDSG